MENTAIDLIQHILEDDLASAEECFSSLINVSVSSILDDRRREIAQNLLTQESIGTPVKKNVEFVQLTEEQMNEEVRHHHYMVHFDRDVLDPKMTTKKNSSGQPIHDGMAEPGAGSPILKYYLEKAGMLHHADKHIGGMGYDDTSFQFKKKDHAKEFARAMDGVIPGPTQAYKNNYGEYGKHHATVSHYSGTDKDDPSDFHGNIQH